MSRSTCVLSAPFELSQNGSPSHATMKPEQNRRPAEPAMMNHFHPRIWEAQDFVSSSAELNQNGFREERHRELKKEVKKLLLAANDPFKELDLVDKIQQLGVGYHYEAEIEEILQRACHYERFDEADLHHTSLRFRLLRQAGFYVSPDIFNKYKDENGEFLANLASDVQGMLSLYEATFLSIPGEDILDDAQAFTTKHLRSLVTHLSPPLALQVERALFVSLWNGVERVHARHYISIYEEDKSRIETLLEFAKLDFNIVQLIHKEELLELSGWWDKLTKDLRVKFPFPFRDRMAEGYIMSMGINSNPQFSLGRKHITKIWYMYTIYDDAHDVYEDVEELQPLHDALQRWDGQDKKLTDHLKIIFEAMTNLYKEIELDMMRKKHFIGMPYLKKEMQFFAKWQFEEAKLMTSRDFPKFEKWLSVSANSVGINAFLIAAVMNLDELATKEVFDWIDSEPRILTAYSLITRLLDDIADFEMEKDRISTITCYMNEYGVSEKETIQALQKMVKSLWKDMNKSLLRPTHVPRPVIGIVLGISRITSEYYTENGGDGHSESRGRTKEIITSVLRDPIRV